MQVRRTVLSIGLMACLVPAVAVAQGQGIALIPFAGYGLSGTLAEGDGYTAEAEASISVGAEIEFGLSKNLGLAIGGSYGLTHTVDFTFSGFGSIGTADVTAPRIYGLLSIRPGGRKPNGAVTPLAIQMGGGMTLWTFDKLIADFNGDGIPETVPGDEWNGNEPFAFAGIAYNLSIGPRSTLQFFGRAIGGFGYSSDGLDTFNATPPTTNLEGAFTIWPVFGVGIRIGR